jgi:E3 ubiquitin-protein ligase BRE1
MQEYKREKNTVESQLKEMRKKTRYHDDHLRVIDLWFKQLIDEVIATTPDVMGDINDSSSIPSSLLFADSETFEKHLQSRSRDIQAVMTKLFSNSKGRSPDVLQLQSRLSQLLAAEKQHVLQLENYQAEKQELEERLEGASFRYMVAEKKLDRAKSTTVAKLEKQALLGAQKSSEEEGVPVNREESTSNGVVENGDVIAELEEAHNKALAVSQKQKEQMEKLEAENSKLTTQLTELTAKSTRFTDDDYASTDLFKQLKSQHEDVIKRINNLEALNIHLQEEAVRLQAERTSYRCQLDSESQVAVAEKEALLNTAETHLTRIRSKRDELLADQAIRKSSQEQERTSIAKVRELAAAHEDRIKALELENERLTSQAECQSPTSADLAALSAEELAARYQELGHKYNMLNSELASMSTAFQKASKAASQKISELSSLEELVMRLTAEKAKADQKYFAAMRDKDQRKTEVQMLRLQNTKSSDVVSQLKESEAASRLLVANLEKQLAETKDALNTKTNSHRTCQQQIVENGIVIEGLKGQIAEFQKTLTTKDASLTVTASSCRKAELEVEGLKATLADTKKSLEMWKAKGLGNQSGEYEMLRVCLMFPDLQCPDTDRTLDSCNLHCVSKEFQRYRHQDLWTCFLQRLRRRTAYVKIPQMPELQQVFWKQRSHEGHSLSGRGAFPQPCITDFVYLVTTSMSVCVVPFLL